MPTENDEGGTIKLYGSDHQTDEYLIRPSPPVRSHLHICPDEPGALVFNLTAKRPNWWWRKWYWLLLGWTWTEPLKLYGTSEKTHASDFKFKD